MNPLNPPTATGTEAAVCRDIAERQKHGIQKYGTTVSGNPLPLAEWLKHAYEESLDFSVYLKRAMTEIFMDRIKESNIWEEGTGIDAKRLGWNLTECEVFEEGAYRPILQKIPADVLDSGFVDWWMYRRKKPADHLHVRPLTGEDLRAMQTEGLGKNWSNQDAADFLNSAMKVQHDSLDVRVLNALFTERVHQHAKHPGHKHSVQGWMDIAQACLSTAKMMLKSGRGKNAAMHELRQVATVCIGAMEEHGAPLRGDPVVDDESPEFPKL